MLSLRRYLAVTLLHNQELQNIRMIHTLRMNNYAIDLLVFWLIWSFLVILSMKTIIVIIIIIFVFFFIIRQSILSFP